MSAGHLIEWIHEAVSASWSDLVQGNVKVTSPEISDLQGSASKSELEGSFAACTIEYSGDVSGKSRLYIAKESGLTLAGMLMAPGDQEQIEAIRGGEFAETQLDALKQAFNQLAETTAEQLREHVDGNVDASLGLIEIEEVSGAQLQGFSETDLLCVSNLEIEGFDSAHIFEVVEEGVYTFFEEHTPEGGVVAKVSDPTPYDNILDIPVAAEVILADRHMKVPEVMNICVGHVIEFKKLCDDPVELEISGNVFANGEVVTTQDNFFAIRLLEISPKE